MSTSAATTSWEQVREESLAAMTEAERVEYDAASIEAEARLQLAELVYNARTAAGLSQTELARRAHTRQAVIIGIISSDSYLSQHPGIARKFIRATQEGYLRTYLHPNEAAKILTDSPEGKTAGLKLPFVKRSMQVITVGSYWGDAAAYRSASATFGTVDTESAQKYFDFLFESHSYQDAKGRPIPSAPQASKQATDTYLAPPEELRAAMK